MTGVILILCLIVVVHEFGHFIAARSIGITVQEFAIGVGPALWKKQGKHALYSIRCLPFGGFCLFDSQLEGHDGRGRSLSIIGRKAPSKMYVSIAGPILNFILAALLFTLLFSVIGFTVGYEAVVGEVRPDSPAAEAGIQPGDRILSIEGEPLEAWQDLSRILSAKEDESELRFVIQRDGGEYTLTVRPQYNQSEGRLMIGVVVDEESAITQRLSPAEGIMVGLRQTWLMISLLCGALVQMATGQISVSENLSGPVALAQVIGQTISSGFSDTLFLTAFLSVNLGIMNLIPFPALDGGRIIVYLVELARRKPMKLETEGWINAIGFVFLISLMLFLTFKDIIRVFGGA